MQEPTFDDLASYLRGHAYSVTTRKIYLAFLRRFAGWLEHEGRPGLPVASTRDALDFTQTLPETSRRPFRNALEVYWKASGRDPVELTEDLYAGPRPPGEPSKRAQRARDKLGRWLLLHAHRERGWR